MFKYSIFHCQNCGRRTRYPDSDGYDEYYCPTCGETKAEWEEQIPNWFSVAVFLIDDAYGGPEEGGWYYRHGHPVESAGPLLRTFKHWEDAIAYRDRLQNAIDICWNYGRPKISSVLSEGEYRVIISADELPQAFPRVRPQYC